jgi:hypothetical protein
LNASTPEKSVAEPHGTDCCVTQCVRVRPECKPEENEDGDSQ